MAAQAPVPGCAIHSEMGFVYVCIDCNDELLCNRCVVETHKRHNFVIIEDFVSEKEAELRQYVERVLNNDNPGLQGEISIIGDKIQENGKKFKQLIVDIREQGNKLNNEINKCVHKLVKLCLELEKSNDYMLKQYKSALEHLRDENKRRIEDCQKTLKSGVNENVIQKVNEIRSKPGNHPVPVKIKTVHFQPGPVSVYQLQHSLGSVMVDGLNQQNRTFTTTTVWSEFMHKSLVGECCSTKDGAWLSYAADNEIYRVDRTGDVRKTIHCKVKVRNITVSPTTGRLWFCCYEDKTVREVMGSNTIKTRFVTDSEPMSLCITSSNKVVVGMKENIVMYCATDGREVKDVGGSLCRQKALTPRSITYSTQTGEIAVADTEGVLYKDYIAGNEPGKQPHIKVMDEHLNVRFRYPVQDTSSDNTTDCGNSRDTSKSLFLPIDVCFDLRGNILVTEGVNNCVLLIDGIRGNYKQTIYMDNNNKPQSISLQTDGTLWVGLSGKKVKVMTFGD